MNAPEQPPSRSPDACWSEFRRSGSPQALGELYDALAPELLRLATHLTRDVASAEDALQATFLAAMKRSGSFAEGARVTPWLVGILHNEVRRLRTLERRQPDPERLLAEPANSPASELERAELLEQLERALERLPAEHRPVLTLRVRHGLSASEIAAALGRPSGTVRSQMQRGLEELRRLLPASLAGALAGLGFAPARGLASVREALLEQAAARAAVASAGVAQGVLMAHKFALSIAVLAASLALWWGWPSKSAAPSMPAAAPVAATLAMPKAESPAPDSTNAAQERSATSVAPPRALEERVESATGPTGAELAVTVRAPDGASVISGEVVLLRGNVAEAPLVARSDSEGRALFEQLEPGAAYVQLLRGGGATAHLRRGERTELELRLERGVEVLGQVVDATGAPLAGCDIWLSERYRANVGHFVTRSDADGRFALEHAQPEQLLCAFARAHAPSRMASIGGAAGGRANVRLVVDTPGQTFRGRVLDDAGAAIAGARLLIGDEQPARSHREGDGGSSFAAPPLRATSDAEGRFEVAHGEPGTRRVQVRAAGFAPFDELRDLALGGAECELRLVREARVEGSVLDAAGEPVAGAAVRRGEYGSFSGALAFTGRDGSFALAGLPPGRLQLSAELRQSGSAEIELAVAPGETARADFVLREQSALRGRVTDALGAALAGWGLLVAPAGELVAATHSTQTDAAGEFALLGLDPARAYTLSLHAPGAWRGFPALVRENVSASSDALELVVDDARARTARVVAQVHFPDGRPAQGARLQLWHTQSRRSCEADVDPVSGAVEVPFVPAGELMLEVRHRDHPWMRLEPRTVRAGELADLGLVVLREAARLRVELRGADEALLRAVSVLLTDRSGRESGVLEREGLAFVSGPLGPGGHVLLLQGDGVASVRREFELREGELARLELALEPAGVRELEFVLPPGAAPIEWLSCTLVDASGALVWTPPWQVRETLRARLSAKPGEYRLHASTNSGLSASLALRVESLEHGGPPLRVELKPH